MRSRELDPAQVALRAYCAGIIDGEGYIGATRSKPRGTSVSPRFTVRVYVAMADRQCVETIAKLADAHFYLRSRKQKPHHTPLYVMDITSRQAVGLLYKVMPYLRAKLQQAKLVCELHDLKQFPERVPNGKNGSLVLSPRHIERCDQLYLQMRRRVMTNNGIEARAL